MVAGSDNYLQRRTGYFSSKYKGFTLIELLAIIVILAIIAVITVPVILNVIDSAKQGAAKSSALGYIDAVKKQIVINSMDDNSSNDVREGTIKSEVLESTYGVRVDGEKPLNDSTVDFNNGGVVGYKLYIGGYIVTMLNDVVTVVKNSDSNVAVESITGLDAITMTVGEERIITASVLPTDATNKALTYTGYDTNIITISNGKITGVAPGNTTIHVTSVNNSSKSGDISVAVNPGVVALESISLPSSSINLNASSSYTITPSFTPDNATNKEVTYFSSDDTIATVDVDGRVIGVAGGTATITVTSNENSSISDQLEVTVNVPVTGVDITDTNFELIVGQTKQLHFNISPTGATNSEVTWINSDDNHATVSSTGLVTANTVGTTTLTVTSVDGNFTDTVTVNVKEKYITNISDDCAKAGNGPCDITKIRTGVSMDVKVNSTTTETFNVIADDGNILTLQMNKNIASGSGAEWYSSTNNNGYGPQTALTKLHELTKTWVNVLPMNYNYIEAASTSTYTYGYLSSVWNNGILIITPKTGSELSLGTSSEPMRARMITAQEAAVIMNDTAWSIGNYTGNTYAPAWLKANLNTTNPYGYWALTSYRPASNGYSAWYVSHAGILDFNITNYTDRGVRPVINISKSDVF